MRAERLWPRSLLTPFTDDVHLTQGDRKAYESYAVTERHKGFETRRRGLRPAAAGRGLRPPPGLSRADGTGRGDARAELPPKLHCRTGGPRTRRAARSSSGSPPFPQQFPSCPAGATVTGVAPRRRACPPVRRSASARPPYLVPEAPGLCQVDEAGAVGHTGLRDQVGDVGLDGARGQHQLLGDARCWSGPRPPAAARPPRGWSPRPPAAPAGTGVSPRPGRGTGAPARRSSSRHRLASRPSPRPAKTGSASRAQPTGSPQPSASAASATSSRTRCRHQGRSASAVSAVASSRSASRRRPRRPASTASAYPSSASFSQFTVDGRASSRACSPSRPSSVRTSAHSPRIGVGVVRRAAPQVVDRPVQALARAAPGRRRAAPRAPGPRPRCRR